MYFVFIYVNQRMKPVEIVLSRREMKDNYEGGKSN
jgi:hypothetical protein